MRAKCGPDTELHSAFFFFFAKELPIGASRSKSPSIFPGHNFASIVNGNRTAKGQASVQNDDYTEATLSWEAKGLFSVHEMSERKTFIKLHSVWSKTVVPSSGKCILCILYSSRKSLLWLGVRNYIFNIIPKHMRRCTEVKGVHYNNLFLLLCMRLCGVVCVCVRTCSSM